MLLEDVNLIPHKFLYLQMDIKINKPIYEFHQGDTGTLGC